MKQSMSANLVVSIVLLVILCIAGLSLCVQWDIGGYCPLTIVVCTIGVLLLAAYADKVEEQEAQVSLLLSQAFRVEDAQPKEADVLTDDNIKTIIREDNRWTNSYEEWKEKHCN